MRIQKIYFLLVLIAFFCYNKISAQSHYIDVKSFTAVRDSLLNAKLSLSKNLSALKKEIDSLNVVSNSLDDRIGLLLEEINLLYVKKFGKQRAARIINKQIWKGMTEKMLRASWGAPDKIDKNVEKWGTFSQWYYGGVTFFFKNGKLTEWEE